MQPSSAKGRKARLALMPLSWAVAALVVYVLLHSLARASGSSISALFQADDLWPLAVILPGLVFGKVLGLMSINLIAVCTPPLRRIFEDEEVQTGRHGFAKAMSVLARAAVVLAVVTALGSFLFLRYR